jgi:hypothetical protein
MHWKKFSLKATKRLSAEVFPQDVICSCAPLCILKYFVTHWFYKVHEGELVKAMKQKNIELMILCGSCDEDCLSMAEQLYEITNAEGVQVELTIQEGSRHQFSK